MSPPNQWGWTEVLANKTNYLLELLLWQNSAGPKNKAKHKASKPKPFVPDFMKQPLPPSGISKDAETHTTDDIRRILEQPRG